MECPNKRNRMPSFLDQKDSKTRLLQAKEDHDKSERSSESCQNGDNCHLSSQNAMNVTLTTANPSSIQPLCVLFMVAAISIQEQAEHMRSKCLTMDAHDKPRGHRRTNIDNEKSIILILTTNNNWKWKWTILSNNDCMLEFNLH